jgi:hypothetical protein
VSPAKRLFLVLSSVCVGVVAVSLALFYGIEEGASGPLPLKEALYGLVDYAAGRGYLEEDEIKAYLESVGWTSERLDATMNNMADNDPEVFWELISDLENYAREQHGVDLWELGLG